MSCTRTGLLDLEKHFAFYGAYHSNSINIMIHTLLVWPNVFATLLFLYSVHPILDPSQLVFLRSLSFDGILRLDIGSVLTVIYAIFYICLDKKAGVLAALLCFSCWLGSSFLAARLGPSLTLKVGVGSQFLCWTGQFFGHGVFENLTTDVNVLLRNELLALLDNLVQAFLMGPFFMLLEVLQSVFGYEPYPGFKARVDSKTESEIKKWREKKQRKIT